MDTSTHPAMVRTLSFSQEELLSFFDERGRFQSRVLRARVAEKELQVVLLNCHSIVANQPEEVHRHVELKRFSMVKARRVTWGYYLLTGEYVYRGVTWRHVFRFERSTRGGLCGTLYFNSRRRFAFG